MKSGTASAGSGAEAEEEICGDLLAGRVHATSAGAKSEKWFAEPPVAGATGGGWVSGAFVLTQQLRLQSQQARPAVAGRKDVCADDIA